MTLSNWTQKDFLALNAEVWKACAIQAAVSLDLFTALDQERRMGLSIKDLAKKINCDFRATEMLVTVLASLGLLIRDGGQVALKPVSQKYLSANSPSYFGHSLKHSWHILPAWANLDKSVRTGKKSTQDAAIDSADDSQREAFLMAMHNIAKMRAEYVVSRLELTGKRNLLDIGGGPGTYATAFCRAHSNLKAVIFDLPSTLNVAKKVIKSLGLSNSVSFIAGDYNKDPIPGFYDVIWISQVLHQETPKNAQALIKKAADALVDKGTLAIQDFLLNDDRRGPTSAALFSLNMLVNTNGGQSYTVSEITQMLQKAGLSKIKEIASDKMLLGSGVITASKL
ncbi:MAG: methyltransferase domain-containing protein [Deltaproteobacteria bacterium]|jgi:protein-L-isoaspartate O-methyltransferase|nr:methyltransferase domain-containing protein [Deltaproteobacteria bacterium]